MVKNFFLAAFLFATSCASTSNSLDSLFQEKPKPVVTECALVIPLTSAIDRDSAELFIAQLEACKGTPVVVEINSPGGSVFAALEIQKAIERHGAPVLCAVDGMAASAAFVTLQSCHVRAMTPRSVLMAHHASLGRVEGQREAMENGAAMLKAIDEAMVQHCARRMGLPASFLEARISGGKEWWFTLEEAKLYKAVDFDVADIHEAIMLVESLKQ